MKCYVVLLKRSTKLKGAQAQYLATALVLLLIQSSQIYSNTLKVLAGRKLYNCTVYMYVHCSYLRLQFDCIIYNVYIEISNLVE